MQRRVLATVVVAALLGLAPARADAWLRRVSGNRFLVNDEAVATVLDSKGHAVVVSVSTPDPGPCRVTVSKHDGRSGRTIWRRPLGRCRYGTRAAVAVDAANDVLVGLPGFVLVKLESATGDVVWRSDPAPDVKWTAGSIAGIVVDDAGDVVAAGDGVFNPFDDEDHDFAVVKVRGATGAPVWHFALNGAFPPCPPDDYCEDDIHPHDEAFGLALDRDGRVVVTGGWDHYLDGGFVVVALDGTTGMELWRYVTPGGVGVAVLATRDAVYAGGHAAAVPIVVRLDPTTGAERWVRPLGPGGGWIAALALHRSGDLLVAGSARGDAAGDPYVAEPFAARLRSAQGQVVWCQAVPTPVEHGQMQAVRLATGAQDTVGLLASAARPGPDPQAPALGAALSLLDAGSGAIRWRSPLAGSDGGQGRAWALAASADGDLVVTGGARNLDTQLDAVVARLRAGDGSTAWRVEANGEPAGADDASAVAVDASGDAFVVGSVANAAPRGSDLAVVKLARDTGEERWRREIDGTGTFGSTFDEGFDVALDATGSPIVAGRVGNAATVLALDGATGAERWRTPLPFDTISDVMLDARGDVVALAYRFWGDRIATVVKLDGATGVERWRRALEVGTRRFAATVSATIAPDGTVVAASNGYDDARQVYDGVLVGLASDTGAERWRRTMPDVQAQALGTDAAGRVVLAFELHSDAPDGDAAVAILDVATGTELRRTIVTPPALRPADPRALAFDDTGGLVVGGFAGDGGAFVARLDAEGGVAWRRSIPATDPRLGARHVAGVPRLAWHPREGVVLGFTLYGEGRRFDWALVGLSGRSGRPRWMRTVDGDEIDSPDLGDGDALDDLAMTPQGDVVAAGSTSWVASNYDLTVLALRARTGREPRRDRRAGCATGGVADASRKLGPMPCHGGTAGTRGGR